METDFQLASASNDYDRLRHSREGDYDTHFR